MANVVKDFSPGDEYRGFRISRVEAINSIRVAAIHAVHVKTGAEVLHLFCDDRENLFSVGFRTPPRDSTGVPHILEHSVLAGSERYPVKDAFNELAKGTLQTFINAFTYPDKTLYPVSSQVEADFFNLARVYSDLVLNPRLLPETFRQEGFHLELSDPGDMESPLSASGIVFNEMRGAYSSPDSLMYKSLQEALFPDTVYRHDSGGSPLIIPVLTYEGLKEFHRLFYSPSNARFFIYGDIPTRRHLDFLAGVLDGFEPVRVVSDIALQPRWSEPRRVSGQYPALGGETQNKSIVNVGWMMMENTDYEWVIILRVLSEALVGNAAGPLRKALIDSGLGEDLTPATGLEDDLRQLVFAAGLRGCAAGSGEKIESLIMETLKETVRKGFDRELIKGSLHQIEFRGREIVRTNFPYSIALMQRAYHTWLYGGDPLVGLRFPETVGEIRSKWSREPRLFERALEKCFLENPHRVLSVLEPSSSYIEEMDKSLAKAMQEKRSGMSRQEIARIRDEAEELKKLQSEPDTPEALATLPRLTRDDIPRQVERIPAESRTLDGVETCCHEIFANGIAYLDLAFDISDLQETDQMFLPLVGKLRAGMGAAGLDYIDTAKRKTLKTGGVRYALASGLNADGKGDWQKIIFRVRMLHRDIPEAVALLGDLLLEGDLSDAGRIRDLLFEARNKLHSSVIPGGHMFARRTAAANISVPAYRDEQWNGRTQLCFQDSLAASFVQERSRIVESVQGLQEGIICRNRLFVNMTGESSALEKMSEAVCALIDRMPAGEASGSNPVVPSLPIRQGIVIPAQVCYVAKAFPAPPYYGELSPELMVLCRVLSSEYLYKNIRVLGGAYGGMSLYDPLAGHFDFVSYRDPHLVETLRVYEAVRELVSAGGITEEQVEKAVIGTIGALDRPMDPSTRGYISMLRGFAGLTDEGRQRFRDGVLECGREKVLESGSKVLLEPGKKPGVSVYASGERLAKANEQLEEKLVIEDLTCRP